MKNPPDLIGFRPKKDGSGVEYVELHVSGQAPQRIDLPSALITLGDLKRLMEGLGVQSWTVEAVGIMHDRLTVPQEQVELVSAHVNYRRCVGHAIDIIGKVE